MRLGAHNRIAFFVVSQTGKMHHIALAGISHRRHSVWAGMKRLETVLPSFRARAGL